MASTFGLELGPTQAKAPYLPCALSDSLTLIDPPVHTRAARGDSCTHARHAHTPSPSPVTPTVSICVCFGLCLFGSAQLFAAAGVHIIGLVARDDIAVEQAHTNFDLIGDNVTVLDFLRGEIVTIRWWKYGWPSGQVLDLRIVLNIES